MKQLSYISCLDGFRGYAVLLVMLFHFGVWNSGWIGVQMFFVLSGFLITRILINQKSLTIKEYLISFYKRRVLRIFPIYYLYVLLLISLFLIISFPEEIKSNAWSLLSYTYNFKIFGKFFSTGSGLFNHLWSLCVEEQFYLIWPIIIFFISPKVIKPLLLVLILSIPVFRYYLGEILVNKGSSKYLIGTGIYYFPISHFDAFSLGALINYINVKKIKNIYILFFAFILTAIGYINSRILGLSLSEYFQTLGFIFIGIDNFQYVWVYSLLNVFIFLIISSLIYNDNQFKEKLFENKFIVYIGKISYGIYLYHLAIYVLYFRLLHNLFPSFIGSHLIEFILYLIIVIALASISFYSIERYFLAKKSNSKLS